MRARHCDACHGPPQVLNGATLAQSALQKAEVGVLEDQVLAAEEKARQAQARPLPNRWPPTSAVVCHGKLWHLLG